MSREAMGKINPNQKRELQLIVNSISKYNEARLGVFADCGFIS